MPKPNPKNNTFNNKYSNKSSPNTGKDSHSGTTEGSRRLIYVGCLPKEVTTSDLEDYFSDYGVISHIDLDIPKGLSAANGFAVIGFKHEGSVSKILGQSLPHCILRKKIKIKRIAKKEEVYDHLDEMRRRRVYLKKVPRKLTGEQLWSVFAQYGEVENAYCTKYDPVKGKRAAGYVIFKYADDLDNIPLDGIPFKGWVLKWSSYYTHRKKKQLARAKAAQEQAEDRQEAQDCQDGGESFRRSGAGGYVSKGSKTAGKGREAQNKHKNRYQDYERDSDSQDSVGGYYSGQVDSRGRRRRPCPSSHLNNSGSNSEENEYVPKHKIRTELTKSYLESDDSALDGFSSSKVSGGGYNNKNKNSPYYKKGGSQRNNLSSNNKISNQKLRRPNTEQSSKGSHPASSKRNQRQHSKPYSTIPLLPNLQSEDLAFNLEAEDSRHNYQRVKSGGQQPDHCELDQALKTGFIEEKKMESLNGQTSHLIFRKRPIGTHAQFTGAQGQLQGLHKLLGFPGIQTQADYSRAFFNYFCSYYHQQKNSLQGDLLRGFELSEDQKEKFWGQQKHKPTHRAYFSQNRGNYSYQRQTCGLGGNLKLSLGTTSRVCRSLAQASAFGF